jgi:hypothetical protein
MTHNPEDEMNTRRYPRTMNEAFGPYANGPIQERDSELDALDFMVLVVSAAVLLVVCVMGIIGWLA